MLMPLFEKEYIKNYKIIHRIPIGPDQLDPTVFYHSETGEEPKMLPGIHAQIVRDLEQFTSNEPQRIEGYYLVGPACRPGSKNKLGELTVIIVLNKRLMDIDIDGLRAEDILKLAKNLSGRLAVGTGRKINYSPTIRPIDKQQYDAIYDIANFKWVKIPNGLST
jgi:hypothetical protein